MIGDRWFADLPSDWSMEQIKFPVAIVDDKIDGKQSSERYIGLENVESWTGRHISAADAAEPESMVNRFRAGDVLFGKLRPYLAKVYEPAEPGVCSTEFLTLRAKRVSPHYLGYVMRSAAFIDAVNAWTYGVKMPRASWDVIGSLLMPIPPRNDQIYIANFLDTETAKADALVAKYERLIELLEEKRTALITQAVTKGLDCSAPMKETGVPWIGAIPQSWNILRLRFLGDITTGGKDTVHASDDGVYPFFVRSQVVEQINDHAFDCEAVMTAGDGVGVGKVFHYFKGKFNAHQRVYVISNFRRVRGKFFYYFLKSNFYRVTIQGTAKSTVDSIRMPMLQNFDMCVPPPSEQAGIVEFCEGVEARFNALIKAVHRAIDITREHRSALITAAVTGQIDVRAHGVKDLQEIVA